MKKSEQFFTALLVPVDYLMILLAGFLAYQTRFASQVTEIRPIMFSLPLAKYFLIVAVVAALWILIFSLVGLYNIRKIRRLIDDLSGAFLGVSTGTTAVIVYIFFRQELFSSRYIIIAAWFLSIITVTFGRFMIRTLQKRLYRYNIGVHRLVIVGNNTVSHKIANFLSSSRKTGYKIVSHIKKYDHSTLNILENINKKFGIDEMIQAEPSLGKNNVLDLIDFCDKRKIKYKFIPDLFETQATNIETMTISGYPIIEMKRTRLDGWGQIYKRVIDIVGAVFGIVVLSPIFVIISTIIKLDSRGPIFVRLRRVGVEGEFDLYKFRSMVQNAHKMKKNLLKYSERRGPLFKMKDDPRVTRVGKFLRRFRLDEFPQLFNVFKGEMSLIGPRPHEPEEVAQYQKHHFRVLTIKPGMSGMAQVSGASDLDFEDEVKLDTYYIENWSLKMDLQILFKTFFVMFKTHGAF